LTSSGFQKAQLLERRDAIVETDLFRDLAILDTEYGCPGEPHLATGCRRKSADREMASFCLCMFQLAGVAVFTTSCADRPTAGTAATVAVAHADTAAGH
jgi:hypothetical protein